MAGNQAQRKYTYDATGNTDATKRTTGVSRVMREADYSYLAKKEVPIHASNDEIFNAGYAEQGLQPTNLTDKKIKGVTQVSQNLQTQNKAQFNAQVAYRNGQYSYRRTLKDNKAAKIATKTLLRAKATGVSASILAWAVPVWLTIQIPFALLSLVMLGVWAAFTEAFSIFEAEEGAGWVKTVVNLVVSKVADMSVWLAKQAAGAFNFLTGIDLNIAAMADSVVITLYVLVFSFGLISLFIAFLQYTLTLHKPLSGDGAALKMGLFMLAIIGYAMPVANLFPWIFLWMAAVWIYPR